MDIFRSKEVQQLKEQIQQLQQTVEQQNATIAEFTAKEELQKRDDSKPWVQITGDSFDTTKGIRLSMDWNEAFIDYLDDIGIKGPTENVAAQRWLAMANLNMIEQLEADAIENTTQGTVPSVLDGY